MRAHSVLDLFPENTTVRAIHRIILYHDDCGNTDVH